MKKLVVLLFLFISFSSQAHVAIYPRSGPAGEYNLITFNLPHSCDSGSTKLTIKTPEGVEGLTIRPEQKGDWKSELKMRTLKEPIVGKSGKITYEEPSEVTYIGDLKKWMSKQFTIHFKAPSTPTKLVFKTLIECKNRDQNESVDATFELKEKENAK